LTDAPVADVASWRAQPITVGHANGTRADATWGIAVESPVAITFNGLPWTVMMATPSNLEDLAVGLALTERVLRDPNAVVGIDLSTYLQDVSVNMIVQESALDLEAVRARTLASSTACGLCGIASLAQWHQRAGEAVPRTAITEAAIRSSVLALPAHQPLNAQTRSVHAAAWCQPNGAISLVREDVGRHNALDKLIGALARASRLAEPGFIVMSSRCSYELVYKAVTANTQLLATLSAPTSLALTWARSLALPLACVLPERDAGPSIVHFPLDTPNTGLT
jgi:FdhD protein